MRKHQYHLLLKQSIEQSTKPFRARGANVVRCEYCHVQKQHCLCDDQPDIQNSVAAMLIMSPDEIFKPSNTGHLIADVVRDTSVFKWSRTQPDAELLRIIRDDKYQPFIVFPEQYVEDKTRVVTDLDSGTNVNKIPLLILLDGSWREARRMFRKSDYLSHLPVISIAPEKLSAYMMRNSRNENHLSTAEVTSIVLHQIGDEASGQVLQLWFEAFKESYLLTKSQGKNSDETKAREVYRAHMKTFFAS